ncbi:MAG: hypothetical protein ACTSUH_07745 [Candidatus Thorarchaeota archaeon]
MAASESRRRLFFGRKDILAHVGEMLDRCSDGGVVIGLYGMGGYGKTAILEMCSRLPDAHTFMLDLGSRRDFYERIGALGARARSIGIETPRFTCLYDLHTWALTGREPVENKRSSALVNGIKASVLGIAKLVPGVSTVVDVFEAISVMREQMSKLMESRYRDLGHKLEKLVNKHYKQVGEWLKQQFGKDYGSHVMDVLTGKYTPDAHRGFDLFMRAMVADFEQSFIENQKPFLFLFDRFDAVDTMTPTGIEQDNVPLTEADLWQLRFTERPGFVLIVAARELPSLPPALNLQREDIRIDQLDYESCMQLVRSEGMTDENTAKRLVRACHYNPALIRMAIAAERRGMTTLSRIRDIQSDEFAAVLKNMWDSLVGEIPHLEPVIIRAAFLPYFNESLLGIIWPDLTESMWDEIINLSFVETAGSRWKLHDLARELALAEMKYDLLSVSREIVEKLQKQYAKTHEPELADLAVAVRQVAGAAGEDTV